jgi:hypothetical protein
MSVTVINLVGTSRERAMEVCGCDSWVDHWRRHTGSRRASCMAIGCLNPVEVGAHVRTPRGRKAYIIGLCRSCNHRSNDGHFEVDQRSFWAVPEYLVGCGVLPALQAGEAVLRKSSSREVLTLLEFVAWEEGDVARWKVISSNGRRMTATLYGSDVRRA